MEKKKVLFISAANNIHTVRWVNALVDKFEVHLTYCSNHEPNINKINERVIKHELHFKAPFGYYLNFIELKKIYKELKPDIVNVHYASGYGTLARVSKIKNVLLSIWGSDVYDFPNESKLKAKIFRKNLLYASYVASTSNIMAEEIKKQVPDLNKEIYITPFGVDVEKFNQIGIHKSKDEFIIGNVKTLENEIYGIDYGILAVKKLKENLIKRGHENISKKIKFYIYGDGKDKENLQKLIITNNLEESVFLKGRIPNTEVPRALNEFDIFCITSNKESFGVSVIEAMACKLPVVATNADGFKEVMEDGKTGIIVQRKNVDEIANALEELIYNKEERIQMGEQGRKKVLQEYNWADNVNKMEEIYNSIYLKQIGGKNTK